MSTRFHTLLIAGVVATNDFRTSRDYLPRFHTLLIAGVVATILGVWFYQSILFSYPSDCGCCCNKKCECCKSNNNYAFIPF